MGVKLAVFIVLVLAISSDLAWSAYCSEPTAPDCASRYGAFDDEYEFSRCRSDMEFYRSELESYFQCLSNARQEALSDYNTAVEEFNRRARRQY